MVTGFSRRLTIGFVGPTQTPHKITFSAFIRTCAGRFKITRKTGHKLNPDDLYRGTPSVDSDNAKLFLSEENRPSEHSEYNADPSQISLRILPSAAECDGLLKESQLSASNIMQVKNSLPHHGKGFAHLRVSFLKASVSPNGQDELWCLEIRSHTNRHRLCFVDISNKYLIGCERIGTAGRIV